MYRVLIVDDEQLMREALNIMISKIDGFEVIGAVDNGEEAIQVCKNKAIDIVFMDIMMPGISGIEASKKICFHNPNITIFIVSAYTDFEFAREALKVKVKEYISKPVSFGKIRELLEDYKANNKDNTKPLDSLITLIKEKDFKKIYYDIPSIAETLYEFAEGDEKELKTMCEKMIHGLIEYMDYFSHSKVRVEDFFTTLNVDFKEKNSLVFWLYNVINFAIEQKSVKKYTLLENVFKYINDNIEKDIGLNEIVEECAVSQGYLSRIFKKQLNVSVMEYIHMRKLIRAKAYFTFSDVSIAEVAFQLGYNEGSYFSKVFKKYEKITAYQYKNKYSYKKSNT
ncbi:two-component system response regulator YesN [Natranaerovirga hydrolytica]|uniref:Stage 0 sporulation protein A homolog n=1 Tax=Natranaerovirga hydrolytica TaxID=680378 RepID=A0A4R1MAP6_9FIRM|nr:response regulator [Natranaerovirga hydrolytica]TCK88024.1 two-component system response regulator YesN [Natranaerovirga hydrolytica]